MRLHVDLPAGSALLPLHETGEQRKTMAEALVTTGGVSERLEAVSQVLDTSDLLERADLLLAGVLTNRNAEPDEFATLTVAVRPLPEPSGFSDRTETRKDFAKALSASLARSNPDAVVQYRNLGCGPTVLILRAARFMLPGTITRTGEDAEITSDSLQAIIPLPDFTGLAVIDVSSASRERWPLFVEQALALVDSVRIATDEQSRGEK